MALKMTLLEAMSIVAGSSGSWSSDAEHAIFLEARKLVTLHGRLYTLERMADVQAAEISSLKKQIKDLT